MLANAFSQKQKEEPKMEFQAFKNKIWLSSPTMHGEELKYVIEAYETNWMSTVGANINEIERIVCESWAAAMQWLYPQAQRLCTWQ